MPLDNRRSIPPFAALRAFEAVGRLRGIRKAADALMVDHAIVSRHIRALEAWVGVELMDRRRGVGQLTEQGERYHARLAIAFSEIANATSDLMHKGDESRLRVWCVPGLASLWLMPHLSSFYEQHPQIDLELRPCDTVPDFGANEADVDIRYIRDTEPGAPDNLARFEIARPEVFPVVSPRCPSLPPIRAAADLLAAPLLHEESEDEWRLWFAAQSVPAPERIGGTRLWHAHLCLDAARQGQGVALGNKLLVGRDIADGQLRRLAPLEGDFEPAVLGSYALTARRDRWATPPIAKFRQWLQQVVAKGF